MQAGVLVLFALLGFQERCPEGSRALEGDLALPALVTRWHLSTGPVVASGLS